MNENLYSDDWLLHVLSHDQYPPDNEQTIVE